MSRIENLKARWSALKSQRSTWDGWWQELADYTSPRKAQITVTSTQPADGSNAKLFDSTAVQANMTLAQGQLALVSPMEERWFTCEPPLRLKGRPRAEAWYAKCAEIMQFELFTSNFYTSIHEFYLDRSGFGTANLYMEEAWKGDSCVNFRPMGIGTYCVEENELGLVDVVFAARQMTARQIVLAFGKDNLPERVRLSHENPQKSGDKFEVVHAVYPRSDEELWDNRQKSPGWAAVNKPFASCWFMPDHNAILQEGGYDSPPYLVSRYLKWGDDPWGWCPGWAALPDVRQLNYLERMLDALAEIQAFPRVLVPSDLVGNVDFNAGGVTVWNPMKPNSKPEEWASQGRYDVGLDRVKRKEEKINKAYHVDLFQLFAQIDRQMTAYEVAQRASEKVVQFSPTFARLTTETFSPMLNRLFPIMMKRGKFPEPPPEVLQQDRGGVFVPTPEVKFTSKIALALRAMQNTSFSSLLGSLEPMFAIDPAGARIISVERASRGLARNFGVPEDWLATPEEMAAQQEAMEQAAMAEQQGAMAESGSRTAANIAKIPPQMISQMAAAISGRGAAA